MFESYIYLVGSFISLRVFAASREKSVSSTALNPIGSKHSKISEEMSQYGMALISKPPEEARFRHLY